MTAVLVLAGGWMLDMDCDMIGRLPLSQPYRGVKASQGSWLSSLAFECAIAAVCCVHSVPVQYRHSTARH